jgi:NitT/TauT family transport system ATP-binding protein
MSVIAFAHVTHGFGAAPVLEDVSLAVARGELVAVVGPSGAGKSTLLALAAGTIEPMSGTVARAAQRIGFAFQDARLLPWRTARGNVGFALKVLGVGRGERRERAEAMLAAVGLGRDDLRKYPHPLSGGMRARVGLARALVAGPDLLLLDEPFASLDIGTARQMRALVRREVDRHNAACIIVTHDLADAVRMADRIVVLSAAPGRIAASHAITVPVGARDDAFVGAENLRLMSRPEVIAVFAG